MAPETPSILIDPGTWLDRFDGWSSDPTDAHVDRTLVHKRLDQNVLIARAARVDGTENQFACELRLATDHPFFFEHPVDHIPGLALIEAGRQMGLVVAHRWYGVPLDGYSFLINDLSTSFSSFAALGSPVFGHSVMRNVEHRRGTVHRMEYFGHYLQEGRSIGHITGTWTILPSSVVGRLKRGSR